MWQLSMIKKGNVLRTCWPVRLPGEAARQVIELKGYPVSGLFLEMHVEAGQGSDAEALGFLEHTGKLANHVIRRVVQ